MGQPEIAERLNLSQSQISRLLKEAQENGVVRTLVVTPVGLYSDLEEKVRRRFGLKDVVIADSAEDSFHAATSAIGTAAATYLEETLGPDELVGISSRSSALQATVDAMSPLKAGMVRTVVQSLGAIGDSTMRTQASGLTAALAQLAGARPVFLATPGVVTDQVVRDGLLADEQIAAAAAEWKSLTTLLTGIGSMRGPRPTGGSALIDSDFGNLESSGAIGDVCLNFFTVSGQSATGQMRERIIGITEDELRGVPRRIAVAGGPDKSDAIAAACRGEWINILITDRYTAERLRANA
ncbi:sugar-binding transcriptional regulator [Brevibacterium oceani]|uniref:sugar-binding transcriptional regulator n=1 Tax=Brevibacterium oceani TaxID=358099 RepID=UPI001B3255AC|nr:sugar-binding domain-containing protein [Brevibacterium oceani]